MPLVVAILDAGLDCTATLPAAAEMAASLHIAGQSSSLLDSVFVCRPYCASRSPMPNHPPTWVRVTTREDVERDVVSMKAAGVNISIGDIRCLSAGHIARFAVNRLRPTWSREAPLSERIESSRQALREINAPLSLDQRSKKGRGTVRALAAAIKGAPTMKRPFELTEKQLDSGWMKW